MKITDIELYVLDGGRPGWRPIVCKVNTDEGISGYGEASVGFDAGALGSYGMLQELAPMCLGMDPMQQEVIWDHLFHDSFWGQGGGVIAFSAISALDMAMWDIRGKVLKVPVWKLLGGKRNPRLRAYASQLQFGWGTEGMVFDRGFRAEDLAEHAKKAVEEGFDAVKINFITYDESGKRLGFLRGPIPLKTCRMIDRRIRAVRDAVGEDVDILLENHGRTDGTSAVMLAEIAKPYGIYFMEEPCTPFAVQICRKIHDECRIAIAGGERIFGKWNYMNLFKENALQVAQPDLGTCGGFTEGKKICDMAQAFDVGIQLHVCSGPIGIAAALQLEAVLPNFVIHEHHVTNRSRKNIDLGIYDYQPERGFCSIPDLPGIGQELSEKAVKTALYYKKIQSDC